MGDTGALDNQTNQGTMLSRTSGKLQSGAAWQAMRDGFLQSGGVAEVRASITRAVDAIVREAFEASAAAAGDSFGLARRADGSIAAPR